MSASSGAARQPIAGRALPEGARRQKAALSWAARALVIAAAVIGVAAIFAAWANRQLLDNGEWTQTSSKLLENEAIRRELSSYLSDQIYDNVDLERLLRRGLPQPLEPLSGVAQRELRALTGRALARTLASARVQRLWRAANEAAHRQLVAQIESGSSANARQREALVLDLRPIVVVLVERLGVPASTAERLPSDAGEVVVIGARRLETLKGAARGLRDLAYVLPALALLALLLAIALSPARRRRALLAAGVAAVFAGGASLIIRSLIGAQVVDDLSSSEAVRPAAGAAWSIATSLLVELALVTIAAGAALVLAAALSLLLKPRRRARGA
jgi:hypothetical protein